MKNTLAPINRLPLDVLSLIPVSLDVDEEDEDLIALTHVCRAWRQIFISQSSLWTYLDCTNADKTSIYLERSKFSLINVSLYRGDPLLISDPFFQIIPHSVCRVKSLSVTARPEILHNIIAHLPPHAPLLERLYISDTFRFRALQDRSPHTTALFSGDLSSLRVLRLESVRTELPWRNMVNLTSVVLCHTSPGGPSIRQLLDFFESTPRLCKIKLDSATPVNCGQIGRLVSLAYLNRMKILWGSPSSLLDHLLIPIGAKLSLRGESFRRIIEDHLPGSLDNLRNISNITKIRLSAGDYAYVQLSGPSGQFSMASRVDARSGFECLVRLDTSKVERLEIVGINHLLMRPSYRGLLSLENLRALTFSLCKSPYTFMDALNPDTVSSDVMPCPKLEEIVLIPHTGTEVDIESVTKVAAARAFGGAKLRTVWIGGKDKLNPRDVLELRKHVLNVECDPVVDEVDNDSDDSDEYFW